MKSLGEVCPLVFTKSVCLWWWTAKGLTSFYCLPILVMNLSSQTIFCYSTSDSSWKCCWKRDVYVDFWACENRCALITCCRTTKTHVCSQAYTSLFQPFCTSGVLVSHCAVNDQQCRGSSVYIWVCQRYIKRWSLQREVIVAACFHTLFLLIMTQNLWPRERNATTWKGGLESCLLAQLLDNGHVHFSHLRSCCTIRQYSFF